LVKIRVIVRMKEHIKSHRWSARWWSNSCCGWPQLIALLEIKIIP